MASPAKKRTSATKAAVAARTEPPEPGRDEDAEDLEVFKAMQKISLRATARELERLFGPAS